MTNPTMYKSNAALRAMLNGSHPSWAALKVGTDATVEIVCLESPESFDFENIREVMGFDSDTTLEFTEAIHMTMFTDVEMLCIVDEDGIANELDHNEIASFFCGQNIYGPALFVNRALNDLVDEWGGEYLEYARACNAEGSSAEGFYEWLKTLPPQLDGDDQDGFLEDLSLDEAKELTTDPERT